MLKQETIVSISPEFIEKIDLMQREVHGLFERINRLERDLNYRLPTTYRITRHPDGSLTDEYPLKQRVEQLEKGIKTITEKLIDIAILENKLSDKLKGE